MHHHWIEFLKDNGGKGMTQVQLKQLYATKKSRKLVKRSPPGSRPRPSKSRKLSKKVCRKRLSKKISINMKEYKLGRFNNRKQAIAVSYSQIRKKYPDCDELL